MWEMGWMVAESLMLIEREELAGPDYHPTDAGLQKWAHEAGSIYLRRSKGQRDASPAPRCGLGEMPLQSYKRLKTPRQFSEELLEKLLRGVSAKKYEETVLDAAKAFGASSSAISQKMVKLTTQKLQVFQERSLVGFQPVAIFHDTIHRGGEAFLVVLGVDVNGQKMALGFWRGSSENSEIGGALFADLERRGLVLSKRILFVTDGGSGLLKALLKEAHSRLMAALEHTS
jgi:hypothetical protein